MSLTITQTCDVCSTKRELEESYSSDPMVYRYTDGWKKWDKEKADICPSCIRSFSKWVQDQRKPKDPGPMPELPATLIGHKITFNTSKGELTYVCRCDVFEVDHTDRELNAKLHADPDSSERV